MSRIFCKQDCMVERFYQSGQLKEKRNPKNGELDGIWEWFEERFF